MTRVFEAAAWLVLLAAIAGAAWLVHYTWPLALVVAICIFAVRMEARQ